MELGFEQNPCSMTLSILRGLHHPYLLACFVPGKTVASAQPLFSFLRPSHQPEGPLSHGVSHGQSDYWKSNLDDCMLNPINCALNQPLKWLKALRESRRE